MALANNKSSHSYSASICFNDFVTGLMSRKNLFFVYYSLYFRRVRKLTLAQIYRKRKHREEEYKGRGMERASKIVNKLPTSLQCNSDGQTNKQAPTHLTRYHLTEREREAYIPEVGSVTEWPQVADTRDTAGRPLGATWWWDGVTGSGRVHISQGPRDRSAMWDVRSACLVRHECVSSVFVYVHTRVCVCVRWM